MKIKIYNYNSITNEKEKMEVYFCKGLTVEMKCI